ncbi:MAG: AAA family ATPase [Desulfatiglandaceae bacterium]
MHLESVRFFPEKYPTTAYYPFNQEIFLKTPCIGFSSPVTFFVGENGTGKSTLLRALCYRCRIHIWEDPEGDRFDKNPFEHMLYRFITVQWTHGRVPGSFFSSETSRNFAHYLDEWAVNDPGQLKYFGGKSLVTQSHGESLMSLFRSRYKIKGLYLMDEPETALSPRSQLELLEILDQMGRAGHAQFIIATHSPLLMACPGAQIYCFDQAPMETISYEETQHYQIYRDFLLNQQHPMQKQNA